MYLLCLFEYYNINLKVRQQNKDGSVINNMKQVKEKIDNN
jgi:hypothetical protein